MLYYVLLWKTRSRQPKQQCQHRRVPTRSLPWSRRWALTDSRTCSATAASINWALSHKSDGRCSGRQWPVGDPFESLRIDPLIRHESFRIAEKAHRLTLEEFGVLLSPDERTYLLKSSGVDGVIRILDIARMKFGSNSERRDKVEKFACTLDHYSKSFDVICQQHAEWTALVWGSMRLVLQVCIPQKTYQRIGRAIDRLESDFSQLL